jgi:hypothetical protein
MDSNKRYQTIKVARGTVPLLRQLSFELDTTMVKLVSELALAEMKRRNITPKSR